MANNPSFSKIFNVKNDKYNGKVTRKAVATFEDTETGYMYIVSVDLKEVVSTSAKAKAGDKICWGRVTRMDPNAAEQTKKVRRGKF